MNRRAQIPRRGIYKRGRFRVASCIGTSWKIAKEPRRFLCRFFAPLSSRRRKGNPLLSPRRRETPSVCFADSSLREGAIGPLDPPQFTPRHAKVSKAQWRSKAVPRELVTMVRTEKYRTQSYRLHKTSWPPSKREVARVSVTEGVYCFFASLSSRRRKGNFPPSPEQRRNISCDCQPPLSFIPLVGTGFQPSCRSQQGNR